MATESPTSTQSTPASSASRALGASYAVTIAIFVRACFARANSNNDALLGTASLLHEYTPAVGGLGVERRIVDEPNGAHARGDCERRPAAKRSHRHVVDGVGVEACELAAGGGDRVLPRSKSSQTRGDCPGNRQGARPVLGRQAMVP